MKKCQVLRKKYPRFVYESFEWKISGKNLEIVFAFTLSPDISFSPRVIIGNVDRARIRKIGERVVSNLVFNLGLVEMLSYWKATGSPEIVVRAGYLDKRQIAWWQDLLLKGMGQYFFENQIDFRSKNFVRIKNAVNYKKSATADFWYHSKLKNRFLVPLAGGKDSLVTLELLKNAQKELACFVLNPSQVTQKVLYLADCQNPVVVRRRFDPRLLELNRQGFLNGHTPFSAYLAFLSTLCAVLFDYKYLAFSNERSANEGNVGYLGLVINHQYSKSFEFEEKFRRYSQKYLARGVEYFSFLRPLYELQIAQIFSRYPKYFPAFLSCNQALATRSGTRKPSGRWCGRCPKCLFVFVCLKPFLGEKKTIGIFGKNLLKDKKLRPTLGQLTGERGFKPFECVGTARETLTALKGGKELEKILRSWSNQHCLSRSLAKLLKRNLSLNSAMAKLGDELFG